MRNTSAHFTWFRPLAASVLVGAALVLPLSAGVSTAPVLMADGFDASSSAGGVPAGWKLGAPGGTSIRVVDASVVEPASPPFCVELIDNSPTARPEMYRDFPASEQGRASAAFKLNSTATAHAALQLRSARGTHLCSVVFSGGRTMRSESAAGNVNSATEWTAGRWETVRIEWFSDFTFNAFLGDAQFVEHARFVTNAVPGKVYVMMGYGAITNRIGYVDDVRIVGAEVR